MNEPLYRVQIETAACDVRARVNDCPVFKTDGRRHLKTAAAVNGWLQQGGNELVFTVRPPVGADRIPSEAYLRGKVTVGDMTQPQGSRPETTLADFELDLADDTGTYPLVLTTEFNVDTAFPPWLWQRGPMLTIDDAFRAEATSLVRQLWQALDRNDLDAALGLQTVRNQELARAMFQRTDERIADVRSDLGRLTDDPSAELQPLEPSDFNFNLFGDGRLARVDDGKERAVIRFAFSDVDMIASVPVLLARNAAGKLVWVR